MQLGYIDYLNCYPFYYHMFEKQTLEGIKIVAGHPSFLNKMLSENMLDMSPISSATYATLQNDIVIIPKFCLSSVGYVASVVLLSKTPIEELNKKRIGISSASHTSQVLLKILLKNYYKLEPIYFVSPFSPSLKDMDAALVIGNDAMLKTSEPIPYIYDLGDLWLRKTGFPVVFAVFAVRKAIISKYLKHIETVINSYHTSLSCLYEKKETVIKHAKLKYPDILYDISHYYNLLKFEFTDDLKKSLLHYFFMAEDIGLLNTVKEINFLDLNDYYGSKNQ
ncbi:MAG: menaquinone biosynthesis protein [Desulfobacterales bacterium]|nr:menaquinone biosynthesis protein [Desulfobacterales bacterium]